MISPDALRALLNPTNRLLKILDSIDAVFIQKLLEKPQILGDVTISMYGKTFAIVGTFSEDTREQVKEFITKKGYSCKAFETRILFSIPCIECECNAECPPPDCDTEVDEVSYFY